MSTENKALVSRYFEAFNNPDLAMTWLTPAGSIAGRFTHPPVQSPFRDEVCHSLSVES
jgi:hypothetical protein